MEAIPKFAEDFLRNGQLKDEEIFNYLDQLGVKTSKFEKRVEGGLPLDEKAVWERRLVWLNNCGFQKSEQDIRRRKEEKLQEKKQKQDAKAAKRDLKEKNKVEAEQKKKEKQLAREKEIVENEKAKQDKLKSAQNSSSSSSGSNAKKSRIWACCNTANCSQSVKDSSEAAKKWWICGNEKKGCPVTSCPNPPCVKLLEKHEKKSCPFRL